jgi:protein arginine kinase
MIWYKDKNDGIIISTRIRLARNLEGVPFPNALKDTAPTTQKTRSAIKNSGSSLAGDMDFLELDNATQLNKLSLAEEHLVSPQMLDGKGKAVLISKDNTMSIMLMEEDHIRLQVILGGFKLDEAYNTAAKLDDLIEESVNYAFDEEFGYLTACPTNAGTGMRASVMMHLPALVMTKNINNVISSATSLGIEIRGLYGEGTEADGNLYQISNRITMGLSESEIITRLKNVVERIADAEKQARKILSDKYGDTTEDRFYRAYGTLKYARSISSSEAKSLLSEVMLGENMGIIKETGKLSPLECMICSTPSMISRGKELTPEERDKARAEFLRENI